MQFCLKNIDLWKNAKNTEKLRVFRQFILRKSFWLPRNSFNFSTIYSPLPGIKSRLRQRNSFKNYKILSLIEDTSELECWTLVKSSWLDAQVNLRKPENFRLRAGKFPAQSRKISCLLQWTSLHEMEEVEIPVQRWAGQVSLGGKGLG